MLLEKSFPVPHGTTIKPIFFKAIDCKQMETNPSPPKAIIVEIGCVCKEIEI
jgi:hypothetical protein